MKLLKPGWRMPVTPALGSWRQDGQEFKALLSYSANYFETHHFQQMWKPDVVTHTYNPTIQEAEAGGSQVQGQSGLQSEFQSSLISEHNKRKSRFLCTLKTDSERQFTYHVVVRPPSHSKPQYRH